MSAHAHTLSPISVLNAAALETLSDITIRFPARVLHGADEKAERWHEGHPGLYHGLMLVPEGAFRVIRHVPSNTDILTFAKNPHWLRGNLDSLGNIRPINNTLSGVYAVAAYRNIGAASMDHAGTQPTSTVNRGIYWQGEINAFRNKMRAMSHMHLSLYGADITSLKEKDSLHASILGNASQGYAFWEMSAGGFRLVNDVNDAVGDKFTHIGDERKLAASIMSTAEKLGDFSTREELGKALVAHWSEQADKKWYGLNSVSLRTAMTQPIRMSKKTARSAAEWVKEEGWKAFAASGLLGMIGSVAGHFVLGPGMLIYALEAIEHRAADEVLVKAYDRMARKRLKKLGEESDVPAVSGVNIRDHFIKRTIGNFVRECPELSDSFAQDIRFLNGSETRINNDSGITYTGFGETYAYEWMLNYPSLGLNDFAFMPDNNSICYHSLNGYTALHYFDPERQTVTLYACMRPETRVNDNLKVPRYVREKLEEGGRILKVSYALNQSEPITTYDGSINIDAQYISVDDMVKEMVANLDKTVAYAADRTVSLDYIKTTFGPDAIASLIPTQLPLLRAAAPALAK